MALWLNIGCGDKQMPGAFWRNVDSRSTDGIDIVTDAGDLSMLVDDSVELIYACHVLEHMEHPKALAALREWARVLKPQIGTLRVCVPDIHKLAWLYLEEHVHLGRLRGLIWGGQSYKENYHYTGWDFEELARDLRECRFFNIDVYDPWKVWGPYHPPIYRDFSFMELNGRMVSLNVEATAI